MNEKTELEELRAWKAKAIEILQGCRWNGEGGFWEESACVWCGADPEYVKSPGDKEYHYEDRPGHDCGLVRLLK